MTDDDLTNGELRLDELTRRVRTPNDAHSLADLAGGMFAARAIDLHRGFLHALEGPSHAGPAVAVRPLVELAILIHWIDLDPGRNFAAWAGHSEAQDAKALRAMIDHLPRPAGDPYSPDALKPMLDAKDAAVAAARVASGRTKGDLRPGLTEMIEATKKHDPGEALALWQAYDDAYRATSPTTHSEATSFKSNLVEHPDGTLEYRETSPIPSQVLRYLAVACLAFAIEAAARMTDQADIAALALEIRLGLAEPPPSTA